MIWFRLDSEFVQTWFRFGSEFVQHWFSFGLYSVQIRFRIVQSWLGLTQRPSAVQIWFRFGAVGLNCILDSVQNCFSFASDLVHIRFRFGSGLARLGATAVQIRFRIGSDLARPRLKASFGSELVQVWHGWPQWRFRFGSALVPSGSDSDLIRARFGQVWHGWAQWWFIFGSEMVQVWLGLAPRTDSVQIRFRFGSAGLNGGSYLVWNWLRFRSD